MAKSGPGEVASAEDCERVKEAALRIFDPVVTDALFHLTEAVGLRSDDLDNQIANIEVGHIVSALLELPASDLLLFLNEGLGLEVVKVIISPMFPDVDQDRAITAFIWRIYGAVYTTIGKEMARGAWGTTPMREALSKEVTEQVNEDDVIEVEAADIKERLEREGALR